MDQHNPPCRTSFTQANLSRENSLALAGLDEVAEESLETRDGDAGPAVAAVRSSFAWAARRKELLSGGHLE